MNEEHGKMADRFEGVRCTACKYLTRIEGVYCSHIEGYHLQYTPPPGFGCVHFEVKEFTNTDKILAIYGMISAAHSGTYEAPSGKYGPSHLWVRRLEAILDGTSTLLRGR